MVCFIPARSGSRGITNKNIRFLGDKPLMAWSIETALACGLTPIVDSDSPEYLEVARAYGAETLLRPAELAKDDTPMLAVLQAEIPRIEPMPDVVVLLQPTTPFRSKEKLLEGIEKIKEGYDSIVSVSRVTSPHPDEMFVETNVGLRMASGVPIRKRITRRQDHRPAYVPTGSFYIFKTSNLLGGSVFGDSGSIYGSRVGIVVEDETVNINSEEDWEKAEQLVKELEYDDQDY